MGWFKKLTFGLDGSNSEELRIIKESSRLIKLKKVNEFRTANLQGNLITLAEMYNDLRKRGIPTGELAEKIGFIEQNLGIHLHDFVQREEIESHDIDSAERLIEETLDHIATLRASKRREAA
ncbi:MAG TPA: hypothetical protein VJI97_02660 [Candidatus Nanoarchaeia archaeon]|nr:hypothetical protein [Candidatus Nanoarchaeia archaeon]